MIMKIALASARIVDRDIKYNLSQMQWYMREAKTNGADLVCFGESFLQGFNALSWQYEEDKKIALTISSQEFMQIKVLTKEIGIDVLFGYNELVDAIGDAIDQYVTLDGAQVTDHTERIQVVRRPFQDVMNDARNIWISYLEGASDDEEKESRVNILNDIITKIFGKPIKLSQALPSQQDLVELFIDETKDLK
jgi:hypothetical protein